MYAVEGLEVALIGAAFDQEVSMAFIDDGVYLLKKGQDCDGVGVKNHWRAYGALPDFDVRAVYVERESLVIRGMNRSDLIEPVAETGGDPGARSIVSIVPAAALARLIDAHDVILNF